jgi:hypothetical protein
MDEDSNQSKLQRNGAKENFNPFLQQLTSEMEEIDKLSQNSSQSDDYIENEQINGNEHEITSDN